MKPDAEEQAVLKAIRSLADEEHRLYSHEVISDAERARRCFWPDRI